MPYLILVVFLVFSTAAKASADWTKVDPAAVKLLKELERFNPDHPHARLRLYAAGEPTPYSKHQPGSVWQVVIMDNFEGATFSRGDLQRWRVDCEKGELVFEYQVITNDERGESVWIESMHYANSEPLMVADDPLGGRYAIFAHACRGVASRMALSPPPPFTPVPLPAPVVRPPAPAYQAPDMMSEEEVRACVQRDKELVATTAQLERNRSSLEREDARLEDKASSVKSLLILARSLGTPPHPATVADARALQQASRELERDMAAFDRRASQLNADRRSFQQACGTKKRRHATLAKVCEELGHQGGWCIP
ncbi:MAG: hypothetical protein Q8J78_02130 [Moraxellaceae bacterium]|nr:hypothetical protein [Moraxellaceae bacterium]